MRLRFAALAACLFAAACGTPAEEVARPDASEHATLSSNAGCSEVRDTGKQERDHLEGSETATYDPMPPTGGDHASTWLSAGSYDEPFSTDPSAETNIYRAVHNLEHAYVIVWHKNLTEAERKSLTDEFANERKVILVPFPDLEDPNKIGLTAWQKLQTCPSVNVEVVESFISLYRGAESAPEPGAP